MRLLLGIFLVFGLQVCTVLGQNIDATPSNVLVFVGETFICGGAILNEKYIVTVASCLFDRKVELLASADIKIAILTGSQNVNKTSPRYRVSAVYVHNEYNPYTFEDDIAVLMLTNELKFSSEDGDPKVLGAVLNKRIVPDELGCVIASWTKTDSNIDLKLIDIPIFNRILCIEKQQYQLQESMLCAGVLDFNQCQDIAPGSGLYCQGSLTGLYSFGMECKADYTIGIFTQIRMFDDWITKQFRRRDLPRAGPTRPPGYPGRANGISASIVLIFSVIFIYFNV